MSTDKVLNKVKGICKETRTKDKRIVLIVEKEKMKELAKELRDMGFDHVKSVTGIDYPQKGQMEVIYHISSYQDPELMGIIVEIRTTVDRDRPELPSLVDIWPSAEYLEREEYDLMGIIFKGHPELKRLLLPEDYEGIPPLRKDFKIPTEGIEA
ncbi:MAG: NADH-quinone oxidoreductase subunit C [Candidatus Methanomethylicota archaeon]|uniref:NADH-quinone oxidoreductase subunit C n=1 Tax=Thermoproteota archaeon TaxID=2056631 RepID=A0A497EKG5_9CREN|nr:MAG: NADH-quinone oxidoreductase subunit C [Candidatus Verstraetearchaeota archaeon]